MDKYPEELSLDEFDSMKWDEEKQFGLDDNRHNSLIQDDVEEYAEKTGGQIYTQVEEEGYIYYQRGLQWVNRTGIWEVVRL